MFLSPTLKLAKLLWMTAGTVLAVQIQNEEQIMSSKTDDPLLPFKQEDIPRLLTIKQAAQELNLEYRQLLSAVNEGIVPSYQLRRGRRLVSVNEILQIMQSTNSETQV